MVIGFVFLGLGIIGIVLPLLPTTPFLIVASMCFVKGSTKMNDWLLNHRLFGGYIKNYLEEKAIRKKDRIRTLILLWLTLIISAYVVDIIYLKIMLIFIGLAVSTHLIKLKTI